MRLLYITVISVALYIGLVFLYLKRNKGYVTNYVPSELRGSLAFDGKFFGVTFYLVVTLIVALFTLLFGVRGFLSSFLHSLIALLVISWTDAFVIGRLIVGNNKKLKAMIGEDIAKGRISFYFARGFFLTCISIVMSLLIGFIGWIASL